MTRHFHAYLRTYIFERISCHWVRNRAISRVCEIGRLNHVNLRSNQQKEKKRKLNEKNMIRKLNKSKRRKKRKKRVNWCKKKRSIIEYREWKKERMRERLRQRGKKERKNDRQTDITRSSKPFKYLFNTDFEIRLMLP